MRVRQGWILRSGLVLLIAGALVGCGDDDEEATVTETTTETAPTVTETTVPSSSGETADLPLCTEGPPPCRNTDGSVTEPGQGGGAGPAPSGGETADLPLCSQGPPPCRTAGGGVVEP